MAAEIRIRQVNDGDIKGIFELSNQPSVRDSSFHGAAISWPEHVRWFLSVTTNPLCGFYVAEKDGMLAGQIRLFSEGHRVIVSISVDPRFRGMGVGASLYHAALDDFRRRWPVRQVIAKIKKRNAHSVAFFKKLGFVLASEELINGEPALVMLDTFTDKERGSEVAQ